MPLEFVFAPLEETNWDALYQGDILSKTDDLRAALEEAHSYYAEAEDYSHFMVLTQSCDLVAHGKRKPRSRYISLSAVRPLGIVIDRLIEKHRFEFEFPLSICEKEKELLVYQYLERLLHNTEDGFFFLKGGGHPNIQNDLCAFLPLSVALRISHYKTCVISKVAQLDNIFQAKVGSLTGNLYSRIGTPDFEEFEADPDAFKNEFFQDSIYGRTAWLTPAQLRRLKQLAQAWKRDNESREITEPIARDLISQIPESIDMVAERAVSLLVQNGLMPSGEGNVNRAANVLRNDTNFRRLVRSTN